MVFFTLGNIIIPDDITYKVDIQGELPEFTLTCISFGGPATAVTWTKNGREVSRGRTATVLNNPVTAQYTYTLTLTGRPEGDYTCTVSNSKPSQASAKLTIHGKRNSVH